MNISLTKWNISLSAFAPENLVSRDGFDSLVPRQPAHLQTQAESGAYLRDSSRVPYIPLTVSCRAEQFNKYTHIHTPPARSYQHY